MTRQIDGDQRCHSRMASGESSRPRERRHSRRINIACKRCHSQKIKCSGEKPCRACSLSNNADKCWFPDRDRNVTVSERYLKRLEAELQKQTGSLETPNSETGRSSQSPDDHPVHTAISNDPELSNPLLETPESLVTTQTWGSPTFTGEASCVAFGDRLLHCVNLDASRVAWPAGEVFHHEVFTRSAYHEYQMPERIHAKLLIQVAVRFIGTDYHLVLKKAYFEKMDKVYAQELPRDQVWQCKFFLLLALGEMYSNRRSLDANKGVPGTEYFLQATSILQDLYETPSVEQIEVLILMTWYSNVLGRVKSAYTYCGIAMRSAIALGLHRDLPTVVDLTPVERENTRRVWWTLYILDRLNNSKLGYPEMLSDSDIDAPLPSMDGLSPSEREEFNDPTHLISFIKLARITGQILGDIYTLPNKGKGTFVQRVHRILHSLRQWDETLPKDIRFRTDGLPRNVASLHLHYNQCVILTTRPILLHIFQNRFHLEGSKHQTPIRTFSPTTIALAESCVQAARHSNSILSRLFIDCSLATFGYLDSHHIFSSTLVLIISAVMNPNVAISDAVQTAFDLLRSMRDDGNLPSRDLYDRLIRIRSSVSSMREREQRGHAVEPVVAMSSTSMAEDRHVPSSARSELQGPNDGLNPPQTRGMPSQWSPGEFGGMDALDNPFIDNFLAEKGFSWPAGALPEDESLQALAHELGDEFMFGPI